MNNEIPIIKIIKNGVDYDAYGDYKLGEVIEVSDELARNLINLEVAVEGTKEELEKWQSYQLGKDIKKKAQIELDKKFSNLTIKIDNYIDNAEYFLNRIPFFYDDVGFFWFWDNDKNKYVQKDDIDVMNMFDSILGFQGQTVNRNLKANYLEAFKRVGRLNKPKDAPSKWIQFKDKAYSISSDMIYDITPDYFFTNPIPWAIGQNDETPVMDKLFDDWVGKDYVETLYEIIAYCCVTDYPIHLIFCLVGCGRNGKSKFLGLVNKFIGNDNICSTELDTLLDSRFESFKLYKKLICCMGETNFGIMNKTSLLKKLTGQDLIGFEFKNKKPFDDYNYAKIMISSNSLPSSNDTSEGFYRRWLIINFDNIFPEGKDILKTIPKVEYNNLVNKVIKIIPNLIRRGNFNKQGTIAERKNKYILASNPLPIFLDLCCNMEEDSFISYNELYTSYVKYLLKNKKRKVKMKEFRGSLEDEGFWVERTSKVIDDHTSKSGNWINGIELKYEWKDNINANNVNSQQKLT